MDLDTLRCARIREKAHANFAGSWRGPASRPEPGLPAAAALPSTPPYAAAPPRRARRTVSASTQSRCSSGDVVGQHLEVRLRGEALGLAVLGLHVEHDELPGAAALESLAELGDQEVRDDAGEPRPRSEHHPVGLLDRLHRLRTGRRLRGLEGDARSTRPRVVATCDLAPHLGPRVEGSPGSAPTTSAVMSSGTVAIGSTRPSRLQEAGRPGRARRRGRRAAPRSPRSAGCRERADPSRRRSGSGAGAPSPRCDPQSSSPHSADRACRRSPGGRQSNSSRSRPEEPPLSATVTTAVRSDDHPAQRRQARGQAVAAAQRDHRGGSPRAHLGASGSPAAHSRPRSRCAALASSP